MAALATRKSQQQTSPYEILSSLYRATLGHLTDASLMLRKDKPKDAGDHLYQAQMHLLQLMSMHDAVLGGEIAEDLVRLHAYTLQQVIIARSKRDVEAADRAAHVVAALSKGLALH